MFLGAYCGVIYHHNSNAPFLDPTLSNFFLEREINANLKPPAIILGYIVADDECLARLGLCMV